MIIKALVENTTTSKDYKSKHGLSIYIETAKHKILFDLGPGKLFYENAIKMGIKIEDIDTVIISHGHYDHGGALKTFLEHNKIAKIYISEAAFKPYYLSILGLKFYIGLDKSLVTNNRLILTKTSIKIDEELQLFSNITEHKCMPNLKNKLYQKVDKHYLKDTFEHEQNLLVLDSNTYTLFAGCAHNGIVNILEKAELITGTSIRTVIGGFHLYKIAVNKPENTKYLHELAVTLKAKPTKFYTCHCTGQKTYEFLHKQMLEQMNYLSTGMTLQLLNVSGETEH